MKVILFGATGMVGQCVLRECLRDDGVEGVLAVGRSSTSRTHPKLRELIRKDLFDFSAAGGHLEGYDTCFFCLGVSAVGMSEAEYTRMTFDLALGWGEALAGINPAMTFVYVSGAGTGGKAMWAQVKKRTEDALLELFRSAYMVRLGALRPMHGEVSRTRWTRIGYAVLGPLLPAEETPRQNRQASIPCSSAPADPKSNRSLRTRSRSFGWVRPLGVRPTASTASTPSSRRHSRRTPCPTIPVAPKRTALTPPA